MTSSRIRSKRVGRGPAAGAVPAKVDCRHPEPGRKRNCEGVPVGRLLPQPVQQHDRRRVRDPDSYTMRVVSPDVELSVSDHRRGTHG